MLVGRKKEQKILLDTLNKDKSSFIALYGRRRIGKTYLVDETFRNLFTFKHTGLYNAKKGDQLKEFGLSLKKFGFQGDTNFEDWLDAFYALELLIGPESYEKKIIFLDELSWLDTQKSNFIQGLEHFWNGWASSRKDIVFIVAASAISWMMNKVIHNVGGLYNRLTNQIELLPFSLGECEEMVEESGFKGFTRQNISLFYMAFGGIPYYWTFLDPHLTIEQNIDEMVFKRNAPLKNEFRFLYSSLFTNPENYKSVITFLAQRRIGFERKEIIKGLKLKDNGHLSEILNNLELCSFIRVYPYLGDKKIKMYQITDPFTIFHFTFIEGNTTKKNYFSLTINTPIGNTWKGLAYERLCLSHIKQIKNKLNILAVISEEYFFLAKENLDEGIYGSQIDLIIDRRDNVINLCEMKYSLSPFSLTKEDILSLDKKRNDFLKVTKTKKTIFQVLVSPFGISQNKYFNSINNVIMDDDLFIIID